MTMKVDRFQKLWKNGVMFVLHPPDERMITEKKVTVASRLLPDETVISRKIGVTAPTNWLYWRGRRTDVAPNLDTKLSDAVGICGGDESSDGNRSRRRTGTA